MPWNETTRKQYSRETGRYESDLTDAEWALLVPLLPPPSRRGRPRHVDLREVVNAIFYMLWTGCSWRALPKDFPAFTTVQNYFYPWSRSGVLDRIRARFTALERLRSGRSTEPSAAIIDSQSVTTVEAGSGGCGYDAGKKIKGRKRHLAVDTDGNLLVAQVHPANIQDRDRGSPAAGAASPSGNGSHRVCRQRLWRRQAGNRAQGGELPDYGGGHQESQGRQGVRRHPPALGSRAHLRMAAALPTPLQRLRAIHRQRPCLAPTGSDPRSHAPSRTKPCHRNYLISL